MEEKRDGRRKVSDSDKIEETGDGSEKINEGNYSFVVKQSWNIPSLSLILFRAFATLCDIYELQTGMFLP